MNEAKGLASLSHHAQIRRPIHETVLPGAERNSFARADAATVAAVAVDVQFRRDLCLE